MVTERRWCARAASAAGPPWKCWLVTLGCFARALPGRGVQSRWKGHEAQRGQAPWPVSGEGLSELPGPPSHRVSSWGGSCRGTGLLVGLHVWSSTVLQSSLEPALAGVQRHWWPRHSRGWDALERGWACWCLQSPASSLAADQALPAGEINPARRKAVPRRVRGCGEALHPRPPHAHAPCLSHTRGHPLGAPWSWACGI